MSSLPLSAQSADSYAGYGSADAKDQAQGNSLAKPVNAEVLTMQDLYASALAEVSQHDSKIVTEYIKSRLTELQRLQNLLQRTQSELDEVMKLPVDEAAALISGKAQEPKRLTMRGMF